MRMVGTDLITEFDPPRAYADETEGTSSTVRFTFEPEGSGVRVRVHSVGVQSMPNAMLAGYARKSLIERTRKARLEWMEAIRSRLNSPTARPEP